MQQTDSIGSILAVLGVIACILVTFAYGIAPVFPIVLFGAAGVLAIGEGYATR
jgi:hypothetical protein